MVKGTFLDKMKSPTGKTMISILWGLGMVIFKDVKMNLKFYRTKTR